MAGDKKTTKKKTPKKGTKRHNRSQKSKMIEGVWAAETFEEFKTKTFKGQDKHAKDAILESMWLALCEEARRSISVDKDPDEIWGRLTVEIVRVPKIITGGIEFKLP